MNVVEGTREKTVLRTLFTHKFINEVEKKISFGFLPLHSRH